MSRRAGDYSVALQVALALSLAAALGFGAWHAWGGRSAGPPLAATLRDLEARAMELVTLMDERRAGHLTDAFARAQSSRWQRVTRKVSAELVDRSDVDATGAAARAHDVATRLLSLGEQFGETAGTADGAARLAAGRLAADAAALVASASRAGGP